MKIGQKFNRLTVKEYLFYIDNYKKYTDFNTLGMYRSLLENEKLNLEDKITVREYAHRIFKKTFDFLQIKDPWTFIKVSTLGKVLSWQEERQLWDEVRRNQEKILKSKQIKHRNFGEYSKHNCGFENCLFNGLMIKQGSYFAENRMQFDLDNNPCIAQEKSKVRRRDRKTAKRIIEEKLTEE